MHGSPYSVRYNFFFFLSTKTNIKLQVFGAQQSILIIWAEKSGWTKSLAKEMDVVVIAVRQMRG